MASLSPDPWGTHELWSKVLKGGPIGDDIGDCYTRSLD